MSDNNFEKHFNIIESGFKAKNNLPETWRLDNCTDTEVCQNFAWYVFDTFYIPLLEQLKA